MIKQLLKSVKEPNIKDRLSFVRVIVCVGFIAGLIISHSLWINDRFYSLVPAGNFIPILTPPFDLLLFAGILILLAILIFYPHKYVFAGFFSLMAYVLLQDQTRWQPWVYQYLFILGAIAWFQSKPGGKRSKQALASIQIILIGNYFWSGLHKLNYTYLFETFEWFIGPILNILPSLHFLPLPLFAALSIAVETSAAIALLFRKWQRLAMWVLISMHGFILLMIGPTGMEFNRVVWPWNISFALLLFFVFLGKKKNNQVTARLFPQNFYHGLVIAVFLILPILNYANLWDQYLSSSLYSGKIPYAKVHVTDPVKERFPKKVNPKFNLLNELPMRDWAFAELHAPDYPQLRVYKGIFRKLCKYQQHKYGLVLEVYGTADLITGERNRQEFFCHELTE